MSKKILVAAIGSTSQVLTETIYALYKERSWIPDEVHVLTTTHGKDKMIPELFGNGLSGHFHQLCGEYNLLNIDFNSENIHVFRDPEGRALSDLKTVDENEYAANMIVHFIHDICKDSNNELHISLAGGRKTMSFYIGYALSLFGRQQDSMSHILVDEKYEFLKDFFYPRKDNLEEQDAVWLADIPFVRMGVGYSPLKLTDDQSYQQAVTLTQTAVSDFKIILNISESTLDCSGFATIKLQPNELSIYQLFIELAKKGEVFSVDHEISNSCDWEEFSDDYLALQKKYGRENDDFIEMDKKKILQKVRECSSKLKKQLEDNNLGPYTDNFGILSNKGKFYQLSIKPENITIIE